MINILIASPGPLGQLAREAAQTCLAATGQSVELVDVDAVYAAAEGHLTNLSKLEIVAERAIASSADILLAVIGDPDHACSRAIVAAGKPFMIVTEEPRSILFDLIRGRGHDPITAAREMMAYYAGSLDLIHAEHGVHVSKHMAIAHPEEFSRRVERGLGVTLGLLERVSQDWSCRESAALEALTTSSRSEGHQPDLDASTSMAVEAALSGYTFQGERLQVDKIIATRAMFAVTEPMGDIAPRSIDVTGRARMLFFGPYIHVPPGRWNLRLVLAFSTELAGSRFMLDVVTTWKRTVKELGQTLFEATEGRYVVQVAFTNVEPGGRLEFRLFSQSSTFDGKISIGYAELVAIDTWAESDSESIEWRSSQNV